MGECGSNCGGRASKNEYEITVPINATYSIGDKISLITYLNEGTTDIEVTVVGRNKSERSYDYFVSEDKFVTESDDQITYTVDILFKKGIKNIDKRIKAIEEDSTIFEVGGYIDYNQDYNFVEGYQSKPGVMMYSFIVIALILIFIVAIATFTLILNSFNALLSRKMQSISVLRTVGATKSQLSYMVMLEGVILTMVGLIVGLALGYLITNFMLKYIHSAILSIIAQTESNPSYDISFWSPL
ncbi:MAG: FtsX-like permease family protein [Erysipelothrix sp.]|nr:FtsX-like permease family protein [Erysipelothrix sp.]